MLEFEDAAAPAGSRSWGRVVVAAVVDILLVVFPTLIAVGALHERFRFLPGRDPAAFGPAEQARIDEIDRGFSRAFETDSALYILSGSGWWLSLGLLVLLTITVYVIIPAATALRTPGMMLLRVPGARMADPEIEVMLDLTGNAAEIDQDSDDQPAEDEPTVDHHADHEPTAIEDPAVEDPVFEEPAIEEPVVEAAVADPVIEDPAVAANQEVVDVSEDRIVIGNDPTTVIGDDPTTVIGEEPSTVGGSTVEDIDITERQPIRPITLADEEDYRRWDREFGAPQPIDSTSISITQPGFEALALPESSLSEAPLTAATLVKARSSESASATGAKTTAPVWNEDWNAWLYWDGERQRWFRHDTDTGRWAPLA